MKIELDVGPKLFEASSWDEFISLLRAGRRGWKDVVTRDASGKMPMPMGCEDAVWPVSAYERLTSEPAKE